MKKIIPICLVLAFIAPQIALASWWNPFTWNIFNKRIQKTTQNVQVKNEPYVTPSVIGTQATTSTDIPAVQPVVVGKKIPTTSPIPTTPDSTIKNQTVAKYAPVIEADLINSINTKINRLSDMVESLTSYESNTPNIDGARKTILFKKKAEINSTLIDANQDKINYSKLPSRVDYLNSLKSLSLDLDSKIAKFDNDISLFKSTLPNIINGNQADEKIAIANRENARLNRIKEIPVEIANLKVKEQSEIRIAESAYDPDNRYAHTYKINDITKSYKLKYDALNKELTELKSQN